MQFFGAQVEYTYTELKNETVLKINHEWTGEFTRMTEDEYPLFQVSFSAQARTFVSIRVHSWLGKSLWVLQI